MMYPERDITESLKFLCEIIDKKVVPIKHLLPKFGMAPADVSEYLERRCRNAQELEDFLKANCHLFFVKNKHVALSTDQEELYVEAINFCKRVLERYGKPIDYKIVQMNYYEKASNPLKNLMTFFYTGIDFKRFLKSEPDVFVMHENDTVYLIEAESVEFFKRQLEVFGRNGLHFMHFRGHIGLAPRKVQQFINRNYNYDDFQIFLRRHSDVFRIDSNGFISLKPHT